MSLIEPVDMTDSRSHAPMLNLSSNNPFRNRAVSPAPPQGLSPVDSSAPPRPVSRNPFLDASNSNRDNQMPIGQAQAMPSANSSSTLTGNAADLFNSLTLDDKPSSNGMRPPPRRSNTDKTLPGPPRPENIPPRGPPMHRPSRSQEQAQRSQRGPGGSGRPRPSAELDIFADPTGPRKSGERRVRRNSDSSVMEHKVADSEEEKKRQERRRRERRHRERDAKDPKTKKPDRKLDIIDQLDATSIYGTGLFHHDGPFDACNPHRNRTGSRRAPMQAFPKDSLNNVLGGGGPLNKRPDHATFLGNHDEEAHKDYSAGGAGTYQYEPYSNGASRPNGKVDQNIESALLKVEPVHGDESLGLGTSTFLEGAPASRIAIQKKEIDTKEAEITGLGRKKSLAQKIRGISNTKRDYGPSGRNPEGIYSPPLPGQTTPGGSRVTTEPSPFFNEFEPLGDKKGESITIVEPENKPGRARAPSSPRRPGEQLQRRVTSDSSGNSAEDPKPMGFLSRVKSLKGGPRKPRDKLATANANMI